MKNGDIQIGHIYYDGKQGLREVVGMDKAGGTVRYRLLAAKVEREFVSGGQARTVIGRESVVTLSAFAAWAKAGYTADDGNRFLLCLQAGKVKLSPAEHGYMVGLLADDPQGRPHCAGTVVAYDSTDGRAVSGLEKKGLLRRVGDGNAEVLPLGTARLQCLACI